MDAALLLLECAGAVLVLRWVTARRGDTGLFAWKAPAASKPVSGRLQRPRHG